ncbi:MAG: MFS transporter [Alphaproteobacteria bacterium]|nr:MFS transporter [Alphaproteobacteria bacterium]
MTTDKVQGADDTAFRILVAISTGHMLNDTIQSLIPSIYPILKDSYALSFTEIGLITMTWQVTASILQPLIGLAIDRKPQPFSLAFGMGSTLLGLLLMAAATSFPALLVSVIFIGIGSSIFHPEASRVARMASGGQHGMAQSLFQVGGNIGSAIGPLLAAFIILPGGQPAVAWFALLALLAMILLTRVGFWTRAQGRRSTTIKTTKPVRHSPRRVALALSILALLVFSKFLYMANLSSFYTFYLIETFGVSVRDAQLYLFIFLGAVAVGTIIGGPIGDRIGRRTVIWISILGVLPFTLLLPFANLEGTVALSILIGLILSSAFPAIVVFAQELVPNKVGTVSGLFFGFAFGMGGLGAALLGYVADQTSIDFVYHLAAYLPAIGLLAMFLPKDSRA